MKNHSRLIAVLLIVWLSMSGCQARQQEQSPAPNEAAPTTTTNLDSKPADPCENATATITGTEGNDDLSGTGGDDVIFGLGGDDTLRGVAGNDTLCGGPGDDHLGGGPGDDLFSGDEGTDECVSGPGKSSFVGCESTA